MENINSFDELCDCIIALDEKEQLFSDISGIGKLIDEILTCTLQDHLPIGKVLKIAEKQRGMNSFLVIIHGIIKKK